jgi:hypothetical protein
MLQRLPALLTANAMSVCAEIVLSDMFLDRFVELVTHSCERGSSADSPTRAESAAAMAAVAWVVAPCEDVSERHDAALRLFLCSCCVSQ